MSEGKERYSPEVIQAALMKKIVERLESLEEHFALMTPEGIVDDIEWKVRGTKPQRVKPASPWFSFQLHNDGPNSVRVRVNKLGADSHTAEVDDDYDVNFGVAKIESIYLDCDSGESATGTITGVR